MSVQDPAEDAHAEDESLIRGLRANNPPQRPRHREPVVDREPEVCVCSGFAHREESNLVTSTENDTCLCLRGSSWLHSRTQRKRGYDSCQLKHVYLQTVLALLRPETSKASKHAIADKSCLGPPVGTNLDNVKTC